MVQRARGRTAHDHGPRPAVRRERSTPRCARRRPTTPSSARSALTAAGGGRWPHRIGRASRTTSSSRANERRQAGLEVQARRLGSPLDSVLTLFDAQAQPGRGERRLERPARSRPRAQRRFAHSLHVPGRRRLLSAPARHTGQGRRGVQLPPERRRRRVPTSRCASRRTIREWAQGDTAAITVTAVRHDDFAGEIKLAVENLPGGYLGERGVDPGRDRTKAA